MFFPLIISTLTAAPISIVDITTKHDANSISVNVGGDANLDGVEARGHVEKNAIRIFLSGVSMDEAEKYFGGKAVRARVKGEKVELKIPFSHHANCAGPVHFDTSGGALTANVACGRVNAPAVDAVDDPKVQTPTVAMPTVATIATPTAPTLPNEPKASSTVANAVANSVAQAFATSANKKSATKGEAAKAKIAAATTKTNEAPKAIEAKDAAKANDATSAKVAAADEAKVEAIAPLSAQAAPFAPKSSNLNLILPALALLGLAGFAFYAQKKRPLRSRSIQILETAHIGPKRSLIVAKIGGETLLLGTSEAGITLLSNRPINTDGIVSAELAVTDSDPNFTRTENAFFEKQQKSGNAFASLLEKFKRPSITDETKTGQAFEDFLADSAEDDELRRKLSQGITGRIS